MVPNPRAIIDDWKHQRRPSWDNSWDWTTTNMPISPETVTFTVSNPTTTFTSTVYPGGGNPASSARSRPSGSSSANGDGHDDDNNSAKSSQFGNGGGIASTAAAETQSSFPASTTRSDQVTAPAAISSTAASGGSYNGYGQGGHTGIGGDNASSQADNSGGDPGLGTVQILAAIFVPLFGIGTVAFIVWLILRRRKQRRQLEESMEETKAHMGPDSPRPTSEDHDTPQTQPRVATAASPAPPVIISSMAPSGNAAYYTGIDTSEALSVRSGQQGQQVGGFMLDGEHHEEPPPPYRPASVPPISRHSSMRSRLSRHPVDDVNARLVGHQVHCPVNPFADPPEDDTVSSIGPYGWRHDDQLSVVSDMSYQDDRPTVIHQAV